MAICGFVLFAWLNHDSVPPKTEQEYIHATLSFFSLSTILSLLYILYKGERYSDQDFGAMLRSNLTTVVVALLINLVVIAVDIRDYFWPLEDPTQSAADR